MYHFQDDLQPGFGGSIAGLDPRLKLASGFSSLQVFHTYIVGGNNKRPNTPKSSSVEGPHISAKQATGPARLAVSRYVRTPPPRASQAPPPRADGIGLNEGVDRESLAALS